MNYELLINKEVEHSKFGKGVIDHFSKEDGAIRMYVSFSGEEKLFQCPTAFIQGYLQVNEETQPIIDMIIKNYNAQIEAANNNIAESNVQRNRPNQATVQRNRNPRRSHHAETNNNDGNLYVIMNTFAGGYLDEGNIGHENINFFVPDGIGDNYLLWLNNGGNFSPQYRRYDGRITLLMVTDEPNRPYIYKVLAYAKDCHLVNRVWDNSKDIRHTNFMNQFGNATKYGSTPIKAIFAGNTYHGLPDADDTFATFYTDKRNIFVPKDRSQTIYIHSCDNNREVYRILQNMSNEAMRMYITDPDRKSEVEAIINGISWDGINNNELPGFPKDSSQYLSPTSNLDDEAIDQLRRFLIKAGK